ncbi:MAG: hypothetical protein R3332_03870 [Pseudohongiellaceae bacterium]|nr:hypothetical protein [Pseudohongiellaceae bacterium]
MSKKSKKVKATSLLPMSTTIGLILGFVLGAPAGTALYGAVAGLILGAGIGYYVDRKNGVGLGRKR